MALILDHTILGASPKGRTAAPFAQLLAGYLGTEVAVAGWVIRAVVTSLLDDM